MTDPEVEQFDRDMERRLDEPPPLPPEQANCEHDWEVLETKHGSQVNSLGFPVDFSIDHLRCRKCGLEEWD